MELDLLEENLLTISYKDEEEGEAIKAFEKIYKSYSGILTTIIKSSLKKMGIYDEVLFEAALNNTFFKLYEKPLAFAIPKNAKNDNCFKAWLSVVANNELKRLIKETLSKETTLDIVTEEPSIESIEVDSSIAKSLNLKLMEDALNTLSKRDKEIIMTLYNYHEEGKNTPTNVLDMICKIHGTTKPNIRKIRQRCEEKIYNYFSIHSELIPTKNEE